MKKNKPYLKFYNECMTTGQMHGTGLFWSVPRDGRGLFNLFQDDRVAGYWDFNGDTIYSDYIKKTAELLNVTPDQIRYEFTPLRQTIVLFLAAMNNEL